jgi:hypothetical protein
MYYPLSVLSVISVRHLLIVCTGSRRVFGTILHKKVVILVDTSGSMEQYMNELKKELAALIWDQLYRLGARYFS